ncbi:MAG: hypothetical protein EOO65_03115 [Methanosarcinales archaeon]|nr:MAG: hypothetical protein EOO65_03115 [Methanosarcinales archaeon]
MAVRLLCSHREDLLRQLCRMLPPARHGSVTAASFFSVRLAQRTLLLSSLTLCSVNSVFAPPPRLLT